MTQVKSTITTVTNTVTLIPGECEYSMSKHFQIQQQLKILLLLCIALSAWCMLTFLEFLHYLCLVWFVAMETVSSDISYCMIAEHNLL